MSSTSLLFMNLGLGELIILLGFIGLPFILWIWAAIDLLSSKFADKTDKLIWLVAIIFLPVVGAILYLIIGRKQKVKTSYGN